MTNDRSLSDLRRYTHTSNVSEENDQLQATLKLLETLKAGEQSSREEGWLSVKKWLKNS